MFIVAKAIKIDIDDVMLHKIAILEGATLEQWAKKNKIKNKDRTR
jgi:hypothetical protein